MITSEYLSDCASSKLMQFSIEVDFAVLEQNHLKVGRRTLLAMIHAITQSFGPFINSDRS
jgi:hypothetical protein